MISVEQIGENEFNITWDENDPIESQLNTWEAEDFIKCIMDKCKELEKMSKQ